MHQESPATRAVLRQAQPSQREGQLDDDVDYQTAYQSARTVGVNGGRVFNRRLRAGPLHRPTVDGVEQGRQGPVDDYTSSASPRTPIAQSETATFANGWLTKMIKARLHLQQSGPD